MGARHQDRLTVGCKLTSTSTKIYQCLYVVLGNHGKELSNINLLHEHVLSRRSQTSQHCTVFLRVCSVSNNNVLIWMCEGQYTV
jgi:hypothetical protein